LSGLLEDENLSETLGQKAFQVVGSFQGVTGRNAEYIEAFLRESRETREAGNPCRA